MVFEPIPPEIERVVTKVMDAAFKIHRALGPGLLETVYEACMCHELSRMQVPFQRQLALPVVYEGLRLDAGLRMDLLVADCVIVELKAVEQWNALHEAQLLTYLKLTGKRLGLLINFNVPALKDGLKRIVL
jgi:GxxExxY protein